MTAFSATTSTAMYSTGYLEEYLLVQQAADELKAQAQQLPFAPQKEHHMKKIEKTVSVALRIIDRSIRHGESGAELRKTTLEIIASLKKVVLTPAHNSRWDNFEEMDSQIRDLQPARRITNLCSNPFRGNCLPGTPGNVDYKESGIAKKLGDVVKGYAVDKGLDLSGLTKTKGRSRLISMGKEVAANWKEQPRDMFVDSATHVGVFAAVPLVGHVKAELLVGVKVAHVLGERLETVIERHAEELSEEERLELHGHAGLLKLPQEVISGTCSFISSTAKEALDSVGVTNASVNEYVAATKEVLGKIADRVGEAVALTATDITPI